MKSFASIRRMAGAVLLAIVGVLLSTIPFSDGHQIYADPPEAKPADDFDGSIARLFARRCLDCHNASTRKGGLDLTQAKTALAGGKSGKVIVPGKSDES